MMLLLNGEVRLNLDLRKTNRIHKVIVKEDKVVFPNESEIEKDILKKIAKDENTVYFLKDSHIYKAAIAHGGLYKLVPTIPPTIEINGIRMHRTKDINPLKDARSKVDTVNPQENEFVLDTCMGLGYTAIESAKRGAYVMTIEKDSNVIELARLNPWSWEVFNSQNIQVIQGDASEVIKKFNDETFNVVIHDPPRFSLAGHLYSEAFYKELFRVLKPKGRLFHYVGNPGAKYRKKDLQKGVIERLRNVGFTKVRRVEETLGVVATKP